MIIPIRITRPENAGYFGVSHGDVVQIDLEDYLCGVVPAEVYESRTPLEALKAQAIAARTYALRKYLDGITMDDTSTYQAYKAALADASPRCVQAVRETAGQVLMYGGKVIQAYYSSSNGGTTKRTDQVWSASLPYYQSCADPWDAAAVAQAAAQGKVIKPSHGVGLSQVGAEYAAKQGVRCEEILSFYYPGAVVGTHETRGDTVAKPKASAVVRTAIELTKRVPGIPYVHAGENLSGMDCQGMVEYCVRANGGTMSYAGSNDMIRNACTAIYTLAEARAKGLIKPGWLVFILKQDGNEPAKYKPDGLGNASHVGLAIITDGIETIDSAGGVGVRQSKFTLWTHCGPAKAMDYADEAGSLPVNPTVPQGAWATIIVDGGLRMRDKPGGAYMLQIATGTRIPVLATTTVSGITHVQTTATNANGTHTGWVAASDAGGNPYLQFEGQEPVPEPAPTPEQPEGDYQQGYDAGYRAAVKQVLDLVQPLQA